MNEGALITLGGFSGAAASAAVCYVLVPRLFARHVAEFFSGALMQEVAMNAPAVEAERKRRMTPTSTLIIIGLSLVIIVLAVQTYLAQQKSDRDAEARDRAIACQQQAAEDTEKWATGVRTVLINIREANATVRVTDEAWHRQVDAIFQLIFKSANSDVPLPDDEVAAAITAYQHAGHKLFEAYDAANQTNTLNPYPALHLNCEEDQ